MIPVEPERYELYGGPAYRFELGRRGFFQALGGGIVVVLAARGAGAQESGGGRRGRGRRGRSEPLPQEISAWLHIGEDGGVTVFTGKVEVGQNARTSLTQAVAEELRAPMSAIRLVMGDTDLTPFDMGTFGSRTTPTMWPQLRKVAAAAREMLIDLAAEQWGAERSALVVAGGRVTNPKTGKSAGFGQLTKGQKLAKTIGADPPLTPATEWKVAGRAAPKVNARAIVTGKHQYSSDIHRPEMIYGRVLRPAAFGATLASLDASAAQKMPGVTVVHDGNFVGVAAGDELTASRALAALHAEWKTEPQPSGGELFDLLKKGEAREPSDQAGSIEEGIAAADRTLERAYTVAYIAHAPLEPRAAVAEWSGGKLTVWTGTQRPFGVRGELAQAFHLPEERVRVIMPDTGAAYGGKHTGEAAIEAARLAKAAGKPVKLVWTREEEFTWAYFRPAGVIEIRSGVKHGGAITAWEFHNYNSGGSGIGTPYDIPNQHIEFHPAQSPLRQGSYRGLAATANHFARESHMDELAREVKMDPLAFRYKNLKDARLRAVLEAAAERFGWGREKSSPERGFGLACGVEKGGYTACCAEVAINRAGGALTPKITRVVTAFECGAVVNPDHLKNQIEGATMMAIGGALFEAIEFENGRILNPRFSQYRVPRFADAPAVEAVLVDRKDLPSAGAGETPIVGLAPAVGNAIFASTGVRLRSLPMAPRGIQA
ncbi:MAG TPA: molybdopterin cofactor-binding domain-containing protein [Bryobacterales bacterium]|nr:molybdopterin cofactor-binding domain-containing protein [Bryobacterales bacterium]